MKKGSFAFMVLVTVVVTGMFIWFSSNHNHNKDFTIPLVLSILFAVAFSILSGFQINRIAQATTIGVIAALIIKIVIDLQFDRTSHNLFPFEIIIDLILVSIASLIGVVIGAVYRRFIKGKFIDRR